MYDQHLHHVHWYWTHIDVVDHDKEWCCYRVEYHPVIVVWEGRIVTRNTKDRVGRVRIRRWDIFIQVAGIKKWDAIIEIHSWSGRNRRWCGRWTWMDPSHMRIKEHCTNSGIVVLSKSHCLCCSIHHVYVSSKMYYVSKWTFIEWVTWFAIFLKFLDDM